MPNRDGSRTSVVEFFGDGEHTFDLVDKDWALLIELERAVGPILPFFGRLREGNFKVADLRETIRLALIGGGKSPKDAFRLVGTYFDMNPVGEHLPLAIAITGAAVFGVSDDTATSEGEAVDDAA